MPGCSSLSCPCARSIRLRFGSGVSLRGSVWWWLGSLRRSTVSRCAAIGCGWGWYFGGVVIVAVGAGVIYYVATQNPVSKNLPLVAGAALVIAGICVAMYSRVVLAVATAARVHRTRDAHAGGRCCRVRDRGLRRRARLTELTRARRW